MSATATKSRIAPMYYDTPPRALPPLPKTTAERRQAMADAVFASVLALQGLLTDKDPKVVIQAAGMILDLDKTQMRHSNYVSGTNPVTPLDPLDATPNWGSPSKHNPVSALAPKSEPTRDQSDPFVQEVNRMQKRIQAEMDAEGNGEVISWEDAAEVTRNEVRKEKLRRAKLREQAQTPPTEPSPASTAVPSKKDPLAAPDVPWQVIPITVAVPRSDSP